MKCTRPEFTEEDVGKVLDLLKTKIKYRINQKGPRHVSSDFECMGIIDQEVYEYRRSIHEKTHNWNRAEELLDIAWAALLGVIMHDAILENQTDDAPTSHLF